jgi:hypothetical protein
MLLECPIRAPHPQMGRSDWTLLTTSVSPLASSDMYVAIGQVQEYSVVLCSDFSSHSAGSWHVFFIFSKKRMRTHKLLKRNSSENVMRISMGGHCVR